MAYRDTRTRTYRYQTAVLKKLHTAYGRWPARKPKRCRVKVSLHPEIIPFFIRLMEHYLQIPSGEPLPVDIDKAMESLGCVCRGKCPCHIFAEAGKCTLCQPESQRG